MVGAGRVEVHSATVDVPDVRLDSLSALFQPRKSTYAKVTYADIGGLGVDAGREGIPGALLNPLEQVDGFLHVVRAFDVPSAPHPSGGVDPTRDLNAMEAEFILNDMLRVEGKLERLGAERQRGGRDRATVDREIAVFRRLAEALSQEQPLRCLALSGEEERALAGFGLLSRKPTLVVVNIPEGGEAPELITDFPVLPLQGKLEMEIAQLPKVEAQAFLEGYGIEEPGRDRVIRASLELLERITFFTVSEEEVRAWTLARGATALDAAGTIHSDMVRGFIRAEIIPWDELLALGGLAQARVQGKLRVEGKDYPVRDGEVVYIRFNV